MTMRSFRRVPVNGQRGYALLMVIFMVATLVILTMAASLSVKTEGQRQKEEELAWRGNQYVRAIRLFYKKNGRFPKTMDELTAYHTDQPRFIRQAYKDPMNSADGAWRLIYVLPNGQLSGSVMHKQLQGAMPIAGPLGGATPTGGPTSGFGQQPTSGTGTQQLPATPTTGQPGSQTPSDSQTSDSPVFGGSIIGVASKIKTPSIRFYKLGTSYYEWEFIWDPTAVTGAPTGTPPSTPIGVQPSGATGTPQGSGQPQGPGGSGQSSVPQIDH
jgi:hypothetical protein